MDKGEPQGSGEFPVAAPSRLHRPLSLHQMDNQITIIKHAQQANFTIIPNALLADQRLTWKAKGILCYLMSKPQSWSVHASDIEARGADGGSAVRSAIKELRAIGYAQLVKYVRSGRVVKWALHVADTDMFPPNENNATVIDQGSKPETGSPDVENPHLEKRDNSNTEKTKTDKTNKTKGSAETAIPLIPESLCTDRFLGVWAEWVDERKKQGKKMTRRAMELALAFLSKHSEDDACEIIHQSIQNGWQGLFPLKRWRGSEPPSPRKRGEHFQGDYEDPKKHESLP